MKVSAAQNIWLKTQRQWLVIGGVMVVGLLMIGILTYLSIQKSKLVIAQIQESLTTHLSDDGSRAVRKLLIDNTNGAAVLQEVFPDSASFPQVVSELEDIIGRYDPTGMVQLPTNTKPTKVANELAINFNLQLKVQTSRVALLLQEIEALPYIIEFTGIEMRFMENNSQEVTLTIGVRIYVQDPFVAS